MKQPIFYDQPSITEEMLGVILARPYKDANEHDFGALKALIPLMDTRQCWLVMEWLGP